jgi:hypothetical protein
MDSNKMCNLFSTLANITVDFFFVFLLFFQFAIALSSHNNNIFEFYMHKIEIYFSNIMIFFLLPFNGKKGKEKVRRVTIIHEGTEKVKLCQKMGKVYRARESVTNSLMGAFNLDILNGMFD